MRLFLLCCAAILIYTANTVYGQVQADTSQRLYDKITYRIDSSHIQSTIRIGGSLAGQYNSSLDAPIQIGPADNTGGYYYHYGLNGDLADLNLHPELSFSIDGLLISHFRYRFQLAYDAFGFGWSDGMPLNNGAPLPYYQNSTGAASLKLSAGLQEASDYFLLDLGYGEYLFAGHGVGASNGPATPYNEVASSLFTWGITAGEDIPLLSHRLYLSPEIYYSRNTPTIHPIENFIPNTFSLGFRLNLEWVILEHYQQIEEGRQKNRRVDLKQVNGKDR
jgi:hypothetical protein